MQKKQLYTTPEVDVLVVQFEELICGSFSDQGTETMPIDNPDDF